jgi:hypothetical protein
MNMKQIPFYLCFLCCFVSSFKSSAQSVQALQDSFDVAADRGDVMAALPFAEKMTRLLEQQGVPDTALYINKLLQLSKTYNHAYRRKEAEEYSLKTLALAPPNDTVYAKALIEWCFAIGGQAQYERADSIAQLAINLWRTLRGEDNLSFGVALFAAAGMQYQGGYTLKAINTYEQCQTLWRKNNLGRPELLVQILDYLGTCYYITGKLNKAEACFKESLGVSDAFPHIIPVPFMAKGNLANLSIDKGRYAEADQMLTELETNLSAFGILEDARYAGIFTMKAQLLSRINKYEEAIAVSKKGKSISIARFGANNPYMFNDDNMIGNALVALGKYDEAATVFRTALDSMRVLGGEDWVEYNELRSSLAFCYMQNQDYNAAIQLYLEAVTHYENSPDKGDDQVLKGIYLGLVNVYRFVKNHAESKKYLQKFKATEISNNATDNWANFLQGESYFIEKNYAAVTPEIRNYTNITKKQIGDEIFLFDDQKRQSQAKALEEVTNAVFTIVRADAAKNISQLTEIALDLQLFTKSLLLTATQKMRTDILTGKDENLKQRYTDWINQKEELAYYYTRSKAELAGENIEIATLEARADSLEKTLARSNAAYNNVANNLNINWKTIHQALQP